jgi:hypothetical protein
MRLKRGQKRNLGEIRVLWFEYSAARATTNSRPVQLKYSMCGIVAVILADQKQNASFAVRGSE